MITETVVPAVRIIWPESSRGDFGGGSAGPATLVLGDPTKVDSARSLGTSVLLDFGEELYGGIRFRVEAVLGDLSCPVRVRLGESVAEACAGTYVDRKQRVQPGSALEFGVTGFRFARVDVDDPAVGVEISVPTAYGMARDIPRLGSFSSDDPRLDRVWEVGARTTHLCMQQLIWDGIKRGRTVWAGDLHPASNVIAAAFGPNPIVGASLDHLRDRTAHSYGPDWMNGIPAYSLWWIITQAEWFLYTGDRNYLEAQHTYLASLLEVIAEDVDINGCERYEGWRYLDWATTRDLSAIHVGYQGLTAWALRSAATLGKALGDLPLAERAEEVLSRVASYRPPSSASKPAQALMVLGGLADPATTNLAVLAPDPGAGLTPFLGYHVLEARALAGDINGALDLVRAYWGAMIDLGATTFWEDFDLDWVTNSAPIDAIVPADRRDIHAGLGRNAERGMGLSLCHAWSAGPTAWLSRHVLGVQPLEPGCRSVLIRPQLGNLTRVRGTFPTPLGVIKVNHQRQPDGSVETGVQAPDSIRIVR